MPELPEVETSTRELKTKVRHWTFVDVWTDAAKMIRRPRSFVTFKRQLIGRKIKEVRRRGKIIIFELSGGKTLLVHQKLTGHFLLGRWRFIRGKWVAPPGPLAEKIHRYLHVMFKLDNGQQLAFIDLRKFGWFQLLDSDKVTKVRALRELGPEPLERSFTFKKFKKALGSSRGRIKQVLMNQKIIAGIGNIYSDEILWQAKIHPLRPVPSLKEEELKRIYQNIKKTLREAIKARGSTVPSKAEEYRTIEGRRGRYQLRHQVYRREGERCARCQGKIKRVKLGARSAHYCPRCQI